MKKAFRLFISSTFADFKAERDLLHNEVFPKIREYCEEKGLDGELIAKPSLIKKRYRCALAK